ncbi:hypothetical protein, partial [Reinekea sp.]|uniref:hypothetical protein n=1 Tax=Reinekea sp. TaxID=1970455 RepID=UPI00257F8197
ISRFKPASATQMSDLTPALTINGRCLVVSTLSIAAFQKPFKTTTSTYCMEFIGCITLNRKSSPPYRITLAPVPPITDDQKPGLLRLISEH